MQYTATSFAEPLQRVFDDVLRPDTDIEVTHTAESQYLADKITYRTRIADAIEERCYTAGDPRWWQPRRRWCDAPTPAACTCTWPTVRSVC